jgi:hypothetical protein
VAFGIPVVVLIVLLGQERRVGASVLRGALAGYQLLGPQQSPERWPRAFVCLAVVPSQGGRAQGGRAQLREFVLGNSRDRFQISWFRLWAELLALAPGARCRLGRSVGSGAPEAGP